MSGKLKTFSDYLGQHAKAWASAAVTASGVAVALFPSDHRVQEIGGGVAIVGSYLLVHIVPNAPVTTELASAVQDAPGLFDQLHLQLPERWVASMEKLVEILQTAKPPAPAQEIAPAPEPVSVPDPAPDVPSEPVEAAPVTPEPTGSPPSEPVVDDFADVPPL
jgi:hypothetical protein